MEQYQLTSQAYYRIQLRDDSNSHSSTFGVLYKLWMVLTTSLIMNQFIIIDPVERLVVIKICNDVEVLLRGEHNFLTYLLCTVEYTLKLRMFKCLNPFFLLLYGFCFCVLEEYICEQSGGACVKLV
uniref:Uncharacterized protein n=1 Tax=Glossina brevipalpis TaxID=37001 RepID=A0A1A9WCL3_9MUSC